MATPSLDTERLLLVPLCTEDGWFWTLRRKAEPQEIIGVIS